MGSFLKNVQVHGRSIEVLKTTDSTMYLGRLFGFASTHDVELKNRIKKAWAKFNTFRAELTDKHYSLEHRMKLFGSVVQPTILYGCCSWTLTTKRQQKLKTIQRKMLRQVLGVKRRVDKDGNVEDYLSWIVRATELAEEARSYFKLPDWAEEAHRRKFAWAGHTARRHDGRWTRLVLQWSVEGARKRGHPVSRWSDSLHKFFKQICGKFATLQDGNSFWMSLAENRESWASLTEDYVNFAMGLC